MNSNIKLCLENYRHGRAHIETPLEEKKTRPETRTINGDLYHKDRDGMWYKGPGRTITSHFPALDKRLVEEAVSAAANAADPRYSFQDCVECFAANTEIHPCEFREKFCKAKTLEDMVAALQEANIQVKTFDGEKWVGIMNPEKKPTTPGPEIS